MLLADDDADAECLSKNLPQRALQLKEATAIGVRIAGRSPSSLSNQDPWRSL